ncbi:MAG: HupE/UreJ family protein [Verrucomicrobia bacterium]|nr:HupE/UreJ family protein [Verrucomicrobiota bacterium]
MDAQFQTLQSDLPSFGVTKPRRPPMRLRVFSPLIRGFLLILVSISLYAHQFSESYLGVAVKGKSVLGHWDIALRDLVHVLPLAENAENAATWEELGVEDSAVADYAKAHVRFKINDVERLLLVTKRSIRLFVDGAYAVIEFEVENPLDPYTVEFEYSAIFDQDPQHRCLYLLESAGGDETGVLTGDHRSQHFELSKPDVLRQFKEFVVQGVWHIWMGFDHVLFLLALLLPSVLRREDRRWQPVEAFRPAAINVVKIVTAFTVAHTITLTLASLELVKLPSRPVEAAIALSVAVAAGNNIFPFFKGRGWLVAFGFGLVHGFGFASVLRELGLPPSSLARALVGFNIGVEAGQLAIVAVFLPVAYGLRESWFYRRAMVTAGSVGIVIVASAWMVDRAFDMRFMPF